MKSLIDLVKERPLLYDEQEAQYKDTESRRLAWQEIASKIHLSGIYIVCSTIYFKK